MGREDAVWLRLPGEREERTDDAAVGIYKILPDDGGKYICGSMCSAVCAVYRCSTAGDSG